MKTHSNSCNTRIISRTMLNAEPTKSTEEKYKNSEIIIIPTTLTKLNRLLLSNSIIATIKKKKNLSNLDIKLINTTPKTVRDIINIKWDSKNKTTEAGIYKIYYKNAYSFTSEEHPETSKRKKNIYI